MVEDSKGIQCDYYRNLWRDSFLNKNCKVFIALKRFDSVLSPCFGISFTTKVYIIYHHLVPFLLNYLPTDNGLAVVSEQAMESSHHHFNNVWKIQIR